MDGFAKNERNRTFQTEETGYTKAERSSNRGCSQNSVCGAREYENGEIARGEVTKA